MQFPLVIELRRSRLLVFLLVLIHGTAVVACWLLPWPLAWRGAVMLFVALSLLRALHPAYVVGLRLAAPDRLECRLADGHLVGATVQAQSSVFARLIVLRLRLDEEGKPGRFRALVILPDQLETQQFCRLRVCLRGLAGDEPRSRGDAGGPPA